MEVKKQNDSRLVLGTAQLGMDYGIANTTGQPVYNTARSIVQEAWESGLREFDTAQAYGQSERILGRVLKDLGITDEVRVITKFAPDVDHSDRAALNNALEISLNNLGVEVLYGLMLHREDMLDLWEKGLGENLMDIVGSGKVKHIGVSVYSPEKAVQVLNTEGISMVQLPTNILDRRFEKTGAFELADNMDKTIYIRSIFLQGLVLLNKNQLPKGMQFASKIIEELDILANKLRMSKVELAMGYLKTTKPNARIVFGAETQQQIEKNISIWKKHFRPDLFQELKHIFCYVDERILNPTLWT
jgi:aryl-alcohol dehydrogenase-like predicted oxidoreductase